MITDRFRTFSLRDPTLIRILAAAIEAVDPGRIVRQFLEKTTLPPHERLFLLGIGKASEPMTLAAAEYLQSFEDALIITKQYSGRIEQIASSKILGRIPIMVAGHPIPDDRSLAAGRAVLEFVAHLKSNDLLICLISGGASALAVAPREGFPLDETQALTSSMLSVGASIDEINILRRQIDQLKGGGLAVATRGKIISLILSDVIGDNLTTIASGPTVPDLVDRNKLRSILIKYDVQDRLSSAILNLVNRDNKPDVALFDRVQNIIIANNKLALQAALEQAKKEGFTCEIINENLHGEARLLGNQLAKILRSSLQRKPHPFCLILGGETTVTLRGAGKGGRNQELALAAVNTLKNLKNAMLVSLATDGNDGPTDAAGAVVTGETYRRARTLDMIPSQYVLRNDAYHFFEQLGDLLQPGYTGTNVNDLIFLFGL